MQVKENTFTIFKKSLQLQAKQLDIFLEDQYPYKWRWITAARLY